MYSGLMFSQQEEQIYAKFMPKGMLKSIMNLMKGIRKKKMKIVSYRMSFAARPFDHFAHLKRTYKRLWQLISA